MNPGLLAIKALSALVLPPLNLIVLCAIGLLLRRKHPRLGLALGGFALLALVVLSTTVGSLLFVAPLEKLSTPLASAQNTGAQAIVLLGGGRLMNAPEYGGNDVPNRISLVRMRYAAKLQRETGLPILVSGGSPERVGESEAAIMARGLREDFGVPVRWIEERSDNTVQNAAFSAQILKQAGVRRILLVTDGMHMPRSVTIFARTGLEVVPAPTSLTSRAPLTPLDFLPGSEGLWRSHYALHEWIGIAWYRLKP